jgi:hypothetical protein
MIYSFTLQQVSLFVGVVYVVLHAWAVADPHAFYNKARKLIRSLAVGRALTVIAGAWAIGLVSTMDLGEFSHMRNTFIAILGVGTILTILFVDDFLFVRALGMILLLAACILLDAAFLEETPFKLIVVTLAYFWVIIGMIFVASPYLFREILRVAFKHSLPSRVLNSIGLLIGVTLVVLAFTTFATNS